MLSYRPDIDGLRAVAVLSVILFHAGLSFVPGGYVGVDVFFVISGFLISSILLKDIDQQQFSLATFYERRIRRIFPPLFAMLFVSSLAAWFILLPSELRDFGKTLLATTFFYSNVEFFRDTSYFAPAAETKPLLHTWSLCVEEQFYFVFPVLLWLLTRLRRSVLPYAVMLLALSSFVLSVVKVDRAPTAAFYLPDTRAWELLLGALLALRAWPPLQAKLTRELMSTLGALALGYAIFSYEKSTPFPGKAALLPCLGTAALIHVGSSGGSFISQLLGHRFAVRVGLVSYALYLWHWPLLVLGQYLAVRPVHPAEVAVILALTVLLSIASYYYVEGPIRHGRILGSRAVLFAAAAAVMALAAGFGSAADRYKGFASRVPKRARALDRESSGTTQRVARPYCNTDITGQAGFTRCTVGAPQALPQFIVWGDSHSAAVAPGVATAARNLGIAGMIASSTACAPLTGVHARGRHKGCDDFNAGIRELIAQSDVGHVLLIARWGLLAHGVRFKHERGGERWLEEDGTSTTSELDNPALLRKGLVNTVEFLRAHGKRVTIISAVPEVGYHVTKSLARLFWWHRSLDIRPTLQETLQRQQIAGEIFTGLAQSHGVAVIHPRAVLCTSERCEVQSGREPFYRDEDHLAERGALELTGMFEQALKPNGP